MAYKETDPVRIIVLWLAAARSIHDRIAPLIAFVLSNAETYLQFADVCEWTPAEWQERAAAVLTAALVAPLS